MHGQPAIYRFMWACDMHTHQHFQALVSTAMQTLGYYATEKRNGMEHTITSVSHSS